MSFLSFLKKNKKIAIDEELDMPPIPPPVEGLKEKPSFPPLPIESKEKSHAFSSLDEHEEELPTFPGLKPIEEQKAPAFPSFKPIESSKEQKIPSLPTFKPLKAPVEFPKIEEKHPAFPDLKRNIFPKPRKIEPLHEEIKKKIEEPHEKRVFVELNDFKDALINIELVNRNTKKLQSLFKSTNDLKTKTDEKFEAYGKLLENIEKRLKLLNNKLSG